MANEYGVDVPKVPFVATAPEGMSEKAVAIGTWVIANGIPCHVGKSIGKGIREFRKATSASADQDEDKVDSETA